MSGEPVPMALGDVAHHVVRKIDPTRWGDELVDHYSMPAWDEIRGPLIEPASHIKSSKTVLPADAVLIPKLNPHIPRVIHARVGDRTALASTEFAALVPREHVTLPYLFYVCSSGWFTDRLRALVNGTSGSRQRVAIDDLLALEIPVPGLHEQREAVRTLELIDQRLSLGRTIAAVAERLGAALYARLQTRASRAPRCLGEIADVIKGASYRSSHLTPGGSTQLVTLRSIGRAGDFREEGLRPFNGYFDNRQRIEVDDILVAQTDLTQAGRVIGRAVRLWPYDDRQEYVASLDLVIIRPSLMVLPPEYVYFLCRDDTFRQHCRAHANGTTVLHLASSAIEEFSFCPADARAVRAFVSDVGGIFSTISARWREQRALAELRKALTSQLAPV